MTRDQFLDWVQTQEEHYEFDGTHSVLMPRNTVGHGRIRQKVLLALHVRLRGTRCEVLTFGAGLATAGDAVRYPDVLVTCTKSPGSVLLIPGVMVVFEVTNPGCDRTDRIEKVREYRAVPSIRRYVLLEHESAALTVFWRDNGAAEWTADALTAGETLDIPELGIAMPVQEFYEDVDLPGA